MLVEPERFVDVGADQRVQQEHTAEQHEPIDPDVGSERDVGGQVCAGRAARHRDVRRRHVAHHALDGTSAFVDDLADRRVWCQRVVDRGERLPGRHQIGGGEQRVGGAERLPVTTVHEHVQRCTGGSLEHDQALGRTVAVGQLARSEPPGRRGAPGRVLGELDVDRGDAARRRVLELVCGARRLAHSSMRASHRPGASSSAGVGNDDAVANS